MVFACVCACLVRSVHVYACVCARAHSGCAYVYVTVSVHFHVGVCTCSTMSLETVSFFLMRHVSQEVSSNNTDTLLLSVHFCVLAGERSPGQNKHDIVHVATASPISLFSINPHTSTANFIDLYDVFPSTAGAYRPRVKITALGAPLDDSVILHEEVVSKGARLAEW